MSAPQPTTGAPPVVVSDTGFLLSVAATRLLLPPLREMWPAGRAIWPKEVLTELQHRVRFPGNSVSSALATGAIHVGQQLLGQPVELDDDQRARADTIAALIGGTNTSEHAGEAAGAILADDQHGLLATADLSAARVINSNLGVRAVEIGDVMRRLLMDGRITPMGAATIIKDLRDQGRPGLEDVTPDGLLNNTWRAERGY